MTMEQNNAKKGLVVFTVAVGLWDEKGLLNFIMAFCLLLHVLAFVLQSFAREFIN